MRRQSQRCHLTSFSMLSLRGTRQYLFHSRRTRDAAVDLNTGYLRSRRDLKDYVIFRSERFFFWREKVTFVLWMGCFELVSLLVWELQASACGPNWFEYTKLTGSMRSTNVRKERFRSFEQHFENVDFVSGKKKKRELVLTTTSGNPHERHFLGHETDGLGQF